jgi:hypothetical protein
MEHDFDSAPRQIIVASEMRPTLVGPESRASPVRQFHLAWIEARQLERVK